VHALQHQLDGFFAAGAALAVPTLKAFFVELLVLARRGATSRRRSFWIAVLVVRSEPGCSHDLEHRATSGAAKGALARVDERLRYWQAAVRARHGLGCCWRCWSQVEGVAHGFRCL
jgi:hypothetical protein